MRTAPYIPRMFAPRRKKRRRDALEQGENDYIRVTCGYIERRAARRRRRRRQHDIARSNRFLATTQQLFPSNGGANDNNASDPSHLLCVHTHQSPRPDPLT